MTPSDAKRLSEARARLEDLERMHSKVGEPVLLKVNKRCVVHASHDSEGEAFADTDVCEPGVFACMAEWDPDPTFIANAPADMRFLIRLLDEREKAIEKFVLDMEIDYSMATPRSQDHASGAEWVLRRARIRAGMPPRGKDPA